MCSRGCCGCPGSSFNRTQNFASVCIEGCWGSLQETLFFSNGALSKKLFKLKDINEKSSLLILHYSILYFCSGHISINT